MMLATDTRTPPTGEYAWEIKYDGIRAQIYKNGNKISIFSRSGRNITERFPELVKECSIFNVNDDFKIDGEIVIFNNKGISDFQAVSKRTHLKDKTKIRIKSTNNPVTFMCFDILELNAVNYRNIRYSKRKTKLIKLLWKSKPGDDRIRIVYQHPLCSYERILVEAEEGVIFKQINSVYEDRRSKSWLKLKNKKDIDVKVLKIELNPAGKKLSCEEGITIQCSGAQSEEVEIGMIVTVEYLNKTNDGKFRMPVYKKIVR